MKYLVLFIILISANVNASTCENLNGKWNKCKIHTKLLGRAKKFFVNLALRGYMIEVNVRGEEVAIHSTFKKPFRKRQTISKDTATFGVDYVNKVKNSVDDSTPPILFVSPSCVDGKYVELIEWSNLDSDNYDRDTLKTYPRYYNSTWVAKGNTSTRTLHVRESEDQDWTYAGKIVCKRK